MSVNSTFRFSVNSNGKNKSWNFNVLSSQFKDRTGNLDDLINHIKQGHAICPALMGNRRRLKKNFIGAELIFVDIDSGMTLEEAKKHPFIKKYGYFSYTTASHRPDCHRFRIVFRLAKFITDIDEYEALVRLILKEVPHDPACKDAVRVFYGNTEAEFPLINYQAVLPVYLLEQAKKQVELARIERAERKNLKSIKNEQFERMAAEAVLDSYEDLNAIIPEKTSKNLPQKNNNPRKRNYSGRNSPCPVCGRTKDQDCWWHDENKVWCHTYGQGKETPLPIIGEYEFTGIYGETGLHGPNSAAIYERSEGDEDELTPEGVKQFLEEADERPDLSFIDSSLLDLLSLEAAALAVPTICFIFMLLPIAASLLKVNTRLQLPGRNWYARPIIWCCLVGESGRAKSVIQDTMFQPLENMQKEADERLGEAMKQFEEEHRAWKMAERENVDRGDEPVKPKPIDYLHQDFTFEALQESISHYPDRGLVIYNDEFKQFMGGHDAYRNNKGHDRAKWLTAYKGGMIKVCRKNKDAPRISIPKSSISLASGTQPSSLETMMGNLNDVDGFWPRFAFCPVPFSRRPIIDEVIDSNLLPLLETVYKRLDAMPNDLTFTLSPEAKKAWKEWLLRSEDELEQKTHPAIRALYPKAQERAARFALVIHCLNAALKQTAPAPEISGETMVGAISLAYWSLKQAKLLLNQFGAGDEIEEAKINKVVQHFKGKGWVNARKFTRGVSSAEGWDADNARKFLSKLCKYGVAVSNGHPPNSKKYAIKIKEDTLSPTPNLSTNLVREKKSLPDKDFSQSVSDLSTTVTTFVNEPKTLPDNGLNQFVSDVNDIHEISEEIDLNEPDVGDTVDWINHQGKRLSSYIVTGKPRPDFLYWELKPIPGTIGAQKRAASSPELKPFYVYGADKLILVARKPQDTSLNELDPGF